VSLGGDDTQIYPLKVAAPPVGRLLERDLPGFPQASLTTYGKYIGGFGLDTEYGGDCSPGYVQSNARVSVTDTRGLANATYLGWSDPNDSKNCRIRVHYSITASFPNPSPNYVTVTIIIKEQGE
jgi:hypothetical protein